MRPMLITTQALPYRVPVLNWMSEQGIRVLVLGDTRSLRGLSSEIKTIETRKIFGMLFPKKAQISKDQRAVIFFDLRLLPWVLWRFKLRHVAFWGIGPGRRAVFNRIRRWVLNRSYGFLAYMPRGLSVVPDNIRPRSIAVINSVMVSNAKNLFKVSRKIVFLGTLTPRKRLDVLLRAVSILNQTGERWNVMVGGDGPERERLENLAKDLSIQGAVKFVGRLGGDAEKSDLFDGAFLSVLPGQAGLSVLESFAYGIPVVASAEAETGGESDNVIHNKTGILLRSQSPKELAQIILSLANNPTAMQHMSEYAFDHFHQYASGQKMAERIRDYLEGMQ